MISYVALIFVCDFEMFVSGFYQPAGPLITVPHGHGHTQSAAAIGKSGPDISPTISPLPPIHPPAPSSTGDSSDNEVCAVSIGL